MTRTHLDLCSGIGGFALAARWSGYDTIGFCEIDPWCRRVLAKNFPGVPQHDDLWTLSAKTVRGWIGEASPEHAADSVGGGREKLPQLDGEPIEHATYRNPRRGYADGSGDTRALDLITGGYPCQPFSLAGKRLGAEDDRHLWPAIAALVAELKPERCLFENVYGHVSMGLDAVLADLEAIGYACGAVVVPAAAVGAPHRRDRVWLLADAQRGGRWEPVPTDTAQGALLEAIGREGASRTGSGGSDVSDANGERSNWSGSHRTGSAEPADGGCDVPDASGKRSPARVSGSVAGNEGVTGVIDNGRDEIRRDATDSESRGVRRGRPSGFERQPALSGESDDERETLGSLGDSPDGLPRWLVGSGVLNPWAGEWEAGCSRTTEKEPDRVHKLKALGNAIVPQVAYEILRAWDDFELESAA